MKKRIRDQNMNNPQIVNSCQEFSVTLSNFCTNKMRFTNDEAVDIFAVYFECLQNDAVAKRVYAARYPNRRSCDVRVFPRLVASLRAHGSFRPTFQRQRIGKTQGNINHVLGYIEENPHVSTRALSLELGISRATVQHILKDHI